MTNDHSLADSRCRIDAIDRSMRPPMSERGGCQAATRKHVAGIPAPQRVTKRLSRGDAAAGHGAADRPCVTVRCHTPLGAFIAVERQARTPLHPPSA